MCAKFGHRKDSHRAEGSLIEDAQYFDIAAEFASSLGGGSNSRSGNSRNGGQPTRTISFDNAGLIANAYSSRDASSDVINNNALGPFVDDGAPYSAVGNVKLRLLMDRFGNMSSVEPEPISSTLAGCTHSQYGKGEHLSTPRRILGSVVLPAESDSGRQLLIRHFVLDGCRQWVAGKNEKQKANILHLSENALQLGSDCDVDHLSLVEHNF